MGILLRMGKRFMDFNVSARERVDTPSPFVVFSCCSQKQEKYYYANQNGCGNQRLMVMGRSCRQTEWARALCFIPIAGCCAKLSLSWSKHLFLTTVWRSWEVYLVCLENCSNGYDDSVVEGADQSYSSLKTALPEYEGLFVVWVFTIIGRV